MRVIIAGSRSFAKFKSVTELDDMVTYAVAQSGFTITRVVSGGAVGIDQAGERWAERNGIPWKPRFRPVWRTDGGGYNPKAGFERNNKMVLYCDAAVVLWDGVSNGTRDTIQRMGRHGKPVWVYIPEECAAVMPIELTLEKDIGRKESVQPQQSVRPRQGSTR